MIFQEIPFGSPLFDEALRLRDEVLRKPLGLSFSPEQIIEEIDQIHLGAYDDDYNLMACLVLVPQEDNSIKMRQVAVSENHQKKGIGSLLVKESERVALEKGFSAMIMNARESALPFYEKLGYTKYGKRFTEVKIPHFKMKKKLK